MTQLKDLTACEILERLNTIDEDPYIEAKLDRKKVGKETRKTVSAFANTDGGWVIMGVEAQDVDGCRRYVAVGVEDPDKIQSEFASTCASQLNVPLRPHLISEVVDGVVLVAGYVAEASSSDKPVYVSSMGLPNGAYIRSGPTDQRCTDDEIARFFQERERHTFDASIIPDASLSDLDTRLIKSYREALATRRPNLNLDDYSDADLLKSIRAAVEDERGVVRPTRAGMLLFAKPLSLRRFFPAMRIDYILLNGNEWVDNPTERFKTIDIEEPILNALPRAYAAVLADLPKSNVLVEGELRRQEVPKVPAQALREVLVNALMHRSYRQHAAIQIRRFPNRVEVINRGHSLVPEEDLGDAPPLQRNPNIASVLYEMELAETKGSGIKTVRTTMRDAGLEPPVIHSDRQRDLFSITLFLHHFLDEEAHEWLAQFKHLELSPLEVRALVHARETSQVSNRALRDLTGEDILTASKCLTKLRDRGLLEQQGASASTYYEPTASLLEPAEQPILPFVETAENRTNDVAENGGLEDENGGLEDENGGLEDENGGLEDENGGLEDESGELNLNLPSELLERLDVLGAKPRQAVTRQLILDICEDRFVTPSQLASLLKRTSVRALTHSFLTPLVNEGQLERLHPTTPSHPDQAYRTVEAS